MKMLDQLLHREDRPVHVGSALKFERPSWLVTCVIRRREPFGSVSAEAGYEVAASTEDEARDAVRSFVLNSRPRDVIESIQATRHSRF